MSLYSTVLVAGVCRDHSVTQQQEMIHVIQLLPAVSKVLQLPKDEPISDNGGTFVITYFRRGEKC